MPTIISCQKKEKMMSNPLEVYVTAEMKGFSQLFRISFDFFCYFYRVVIFIKLQLSFFCGGGVDVDVSGLCVCFLGVEGMGSWWDLAFCESSYGKLGCDQV